MVIFVSFIMISSVIGFLYGSQNNEMKYENFKFIRNQNKWLVTVNDKNLAFDYFPTEVEYINLSQDIKIILLNKMEIDITSQVNDTFLEDIALAQYDMNLVLNNLNIYLRTGFTTNNTFNLPIITCEDATLSVPVIYFKQSNKTEINLENNCIIAEAKEYTDIPRIKDRLVYAIVNIIR